LNRSRRIGIVGLIVCLLLGSGGETSVAQVDSTLWSEPLNLSYSGAAEAPVLVAGAEDQHQVFWWDRFDGIMTSYTTDGDQWSPAAAAPIQWVEVDEGAGAEVITATVASMPQIVGGDEAALALWLGEAVEGTEIRPLLYSRLSLGTALWTAPEPLAESAADWEITRDLQGAWHLVYRQPQQLETFPAGIYYQHSMDGGVSWSAPTAVYTSLYVRLWPVETSYLSVAADGLGNVLVSWDDPRQERTFYTLSTDDGVSWNAPVELRDGDTVGQHARFVALPAASRGKEHSEILMLWQQRGGAAACVLMQQRSEDGGKTWDVASRVLTDLTSCSAQVATMSNPAGEVFLKQGEGAESLLLAVWNGAQWSSILPLNFSFENPATGEMNYLGALQVQVTQNNALMMAGQGQDGEIWVLQGQVDAAAWAFAPPSPWSKYEIVSDKAMLADLPAVALDSEGRVHLLWSAALAADRPETALYYSCWDGEAWSRPTVVLGVEDGMARSPALALVDGILHAVWSGGATGTVFYSWAYPRDAYAASSWSAPYRLGESDVASSPTIAVDLWNRLHVVYAVPLNEGRGIYYTRTDDNGESWLDVVRIFDAATDHWTGVDHPSVTVDERGMLHVVWVRTSLPDYGPPQGVYYAQSTNNGKTWSEARILTDGAYDWPQLATTLAGQIIVIWQDLTRYVSQYRVSDNYGQTWGYVSQIRGLEAMKGRITLSNDNTGGVHLAALDIETAIGVELIHLTFVDGQWLLSDPADLEHIYSPVGGAVPLVSGDLGLMDVVGTGTQRGDHEPVLSLWHTRRTIESRAAIDPGVQLNPTPTLLPSPTPAPSPTPRLAVNPSAPQPSVPVIALGPISFPVLAFGGIGIALFLVGSVVIWKLTKR